MGPLRHTLASTTYDERITLCRSIAHRDDHCGGPEPPELLVTRPKAAFSGARLRVAVHESRAGQRYLDPRCWAASPMNQWRGCRCEVETLAGATLIASHTGSIASQLGLRLL